MELENIKNKVEEYKQALLDRDEKRKRWSSDTKNLILKTLRQIQNTFTELRWTVQDIDAGANWETVNIQFGATNSGMRETTESGIRALTKYSSYLAFSQTYNGELLVFIVYPHIQDHLSQIPNEVIEKISPFNISEQYIIEKVEYFLSKMVNWEKGIFEKNSEKIPIEPIGFKIPYAGGINS